MFQTELQSRCYTLTRWYTVLKGEEEELNIERERKKLF